VDLNSLDRYVKSSPRFVLEEHSHCEVPAGCGGVVLRWRDRFTSIPLDIALATVGAERADVHADGVPLPSVRPLLAPGRHVLMVAAHGVEAATFVFLLWITSPDAGDDPLLWTPGPLDAWRATGSEPAESAWTDPDADLSAWSPCLPAQVEGSTKMPYSVSHTLRLGAQPLTVDPALPGGDARVWLRATFQIAEAS
jgi:hypothetical protein